MIENEIEEIMDDEDTINIYNTKEFLDLVWSLRDKVIDIIEQFYYKFPDDSTTIKLRVHPVLLQSCSTSKSFTSIPLEIQVAQILHKIDWKKDRKTRQKILESIACMVLSLSNYRYGTKIHIENSILIEYNTVIFTVIKRKEGTKIGSR